MNNYRCPQCSLRRGHWRRLRLEINNKRGVRKKYLSTHLVQNKSVRKLIKTPTDMKERSSYLGAKNEQEDLKFLFYNPNSYSVSITEIQQKKNLRFLVTTY